MRYEEGLKIRQTASTLNSKIKNYSHCYQTNIPVRIKNTISRCRRHGYFLRQTCYYFSLCIRISSIRCELVTSAFWCVPMYVHVCIILVILLEIFQTFVVLNIIVSRSCFFINWKFIKVGGKKKKKEKTTVMQVHAVQGDKTATAVS